MFSRNHSFHFGHIVAYHDFYQFREWCFAWIPSQYGSGFGRVTEQLFHFGRAEVFRVDLYQYFAGGRVDSFLIDAFALPTQVDAYFGKCQCTEFADGMHFAGSDYEIFGYVMLQDQPHTFYIIFGIAPVTLGIQVTQI